MAVRITEAQTAQMRDDAYVLVTQKETVNGAETEVLRRVNIVDLNAGLKTAIKNLTDASIPYNEDGSFANMVYKTLGLYVDENGDIAQKEDD